MITKLLTSIVQRMNMRCYSYKASVKHVIDLRSDVIAKPSSEMLSSMLSANLGDDVYKENTTVNELESACADLYGMEAGLFVPSGTMGNLICLMAHVRGRGEELLIGDKQHVYCYEQAHFMQLASIPACVLPNQQDGTISLDDIRENIKDGSDFHFAETKLICLENSHMARAGVPLTASYMKDVTDLANIHRIKVHVDGARLYNAAVALGVDVKDLLVNVDSVSMCLSKGLSCPVGSVIGGTKDFINRANRIRKSLGGGMRKSGVLAAPGLMALKDACRVISRDHANAYKLAEEIDALKCAEMMVDLQNVHTNIVFVETAHAQKVCDLLRNRGVLVSPFSHGTIRFVLNSTVTEDDVTVVIDALKEVIDSAL